MHTSLKGFELSILMCFISGITSSESNDEGFSMPPPPPMPPAGNFAPPPPPPQPKFSHSQTNSSAFLKPTTKSNLEILL